MGIVGVFVFFLISFFVAGGFWDSVGGPHPQYGWDFPEEIPEKLRKDPGNALRAFPGILLGSTAGMPQTL